jgi:hypothetical protein
MNAIRCTAVVALLLAAGGYGCTPKPDVAAIGDAIALPFIENDFGAALVRAREANVPLFVEVWAPW